MFRMFLYFVSFQNIAGKKLKSLLAFDPRYFTFASTLSGAIERLKSKIVITYPKDVEIVELTKRLLRGGYSSVHTRLGFDSEIFTPKTEDYLKKKEDIVENLRNLYGDPNEEKDRKI